MANQGSSAGERDECAHREHLLVRVLFFQHSPVQDKLATRVMQWSHLECHSDLRHQNMISADCPIVFKPVCRGVAVIPGLRQVVYPSVSLYEDKATLLVLQTVIGNRVKSRANDHDDHLLKGRCYLAFTAFTFGGGLLVLCSLHDRIMTAPCWMTRLYNRISTNDSKWRRNPQVTANMVSSSSSFYHNELSRALSEQSFGLTQYEVTRQYSAHQATALVTLLEGTNIRVTLNTRGYQVNLHHLKTDMIADWTLFQKLDGGQTYESIEELLQSISPMYVQKREETIITKLQGLQ